MTVESKPVSQEPISPEVRDRAILPVLIPVGAILLTEIIVFSMSRVLLATGKTTAVVIALVAALGILIGAAMIAARPKVKTQALVGVMTVLVIGSAAAGAWGIQRGPFYGDEGPHVQAEVIVKAESLVFDTDTLVLRSSGTVVALENEDTQAHNIAVFTSEEDLASPLFRGDLVQPADSIVYDVPELALGTFYFHCDVHPNMNGDVEVTEEGPPPPPTQEASDA
jgi:plastocyanin